jgi:hypothetical protein
MTNKKLKINYIYIATKKKKNSKILENKNLCCSMKLVGVAPSSSIYIREWGGSTN